MCKSLPKIPNNLYTVHHMMIWQCKSLQILKYFHQDDSKALVEARTMIGQLIGQWIGQAYMLQ